MTSWSADDICFSYIKYVLLVRHLGFACVLLYIARSGLLHSLCLFKQEDVRDNKHRQLLPWHQSQRPQVLRWQIQSKLINVFI